MKNSVAIFILFIMTFSGAVMARETAIIPVIPYPMNLELLDGRFTITSQTEIIVSPETRPIGQYFSRLLAPAMGFDIQVKEYPRTEKKTGCIILDLIEDTTGLGPEGYKLTVLDDRIVAGAPSLAGVFYACQTICQLLPPAIEKSEKVPNTAWAVPGVKIEDRPRFPWRGFMIDCSRTFQSMEYLKRFIDLLALYKLNVFHLHLTDDQGWRVEIKKYPRLTEFGSKFAPRYNQQGGYYSQDELRKLIRYAAERKVTIVPEIEMPGHCLAALASYPDLSCFGKQFEIYPFFQGPNIQENVFCAGKESTFEFLENVLDEVVELFPSDYVHIGGDEVPKIVWKKCPKCQARIKAEGLRNENELQSYFVRRIEKFLKTKNKRLVGWDEIIEGGLAPEAAVMSWRGMEGGITAAGQGHDVIMSPTSHCYLDYEHDKISVEKAYSFDPIPRELPAGKRKHILGLQGNMWTHIATNEDAVDRQVFPRQIALAEVAWSPADRRNWKSFSERLKTHFSRLEARGVKYFSDEPGK